MPRKPAAAKATSQSVDAVDNGHDAKGRFTSANPGRKKGSVNKVTRIQREAAMEAFEPMAKEALTKGRNHIKTCKLDACTVCVSWARLAFEYHYGKPAQPVEIDVSVIEKRLERLSETTGKPIEELLQEAEREGMPFIASGRRVV